MEVSIPFKLVANECNRPSKERSYYRVLEPYVNIKPITINCFLKQELKKNDCSNWVSSVLITGL